MGWWDFLKLPFEQEEVDRCLSLETTHLGQGLDQVLGELMKARRIPWSHWERVRERGFGRAAALWLQASPDHEAAKARKILQALSHRPEWREHFPMPIPARPELARGPLAAPRGPAQLRAELTPQRLEPEAQRVTVDSPGFVGDGLLLARCQEERYDPAPEGGSYVTTRCSIQCWECATLEHRWSWPHDGLLAAATSQGSYWAHTRRDGVAVLGPAGVEESLPLPFWLVFLHPTPDGRSLVAASDHQAYRFDAATRRLAARRALERPVANAHSMNAYFNADEDEMLLSFEKTQHPVYRFRLRDLRQFPLRSSWRELPAFAHNLPASERRALSPDGSWLAGPAEGSPSGDKLQLWSCAPQDVAPDP